jgi:hypothetical protein
MKNKTVKCAGELNHVREVSLSGTADLSFWKDRLKNEDLAPAESDGKAQILVVAADSKFKGVKFREVSFSVLVTDPENGKAQEAAFLVQAFNSCRFFAFCERVFFSTPYLHAGARVSAALSASIQLTLQKEVIFDAGMRTCDSAPKREPSHSGEGGWGGPGVGGDSNGKLLSQPVADELHGLPVPLPVRGVCRPLSAAQPGGHLPRPLFPSLMPHWNDIASV